MEKIMIGETWAIFDLYLAGNSANLTSYKAPQRVRRSFRFSLGGCDFEITPWYRKGITTFKTFHVGPRIVPLELSGAQFSAVTGDGYYLPNYGPGEKCYSIEELPQLYFANKVKGEANRFLKTSIRNWEDFSGLQDVLRIA